MINTSLPLPFDTRRAAHDRIASTKEKTYELIVQFARVRGHYGLTADELSEDWNCSHNRVAPRISKLARAGQLVKTQRTRLTRSHSPARVYVLAEFRERHRDDG